MAAPLTAQDFAPHVGKSLQPAGQDRVLTLVKVDINENLGWADGSRKAFSLFLRGPRGDVLPEGLYDIAVPDGPRAELYVIPIHTTARSHQDYQVVFN